MRPENMFYKDQTATANQTMTIPAGCFVTGVDLDAAPPYIYVASEADAALSAVKIELPPALAFFLRVHWCCTNDVRNRIEKNAKLELQSQLRKLLGVEKGGTE